MPRTYGTVETMDLDCIPFKIIHERANVCEVHSCPTFHVGLFYTSFYAGSRPVIIEATLKLIVIFFSLEKVELKV